MSGIVGPVVDWVRRACYRWWWRGRYWWLDTPGGRAASIFALAICWMGVVLQITHQMVVANGSGAEGAGKTGDTTVAGIAPWVVQIVIMAVVSAISYIRRPKAEKPKPQSADAPTVEDGLAARDVFGTVWVDDEFLLAWKPMGVQAIKKKGGKK